MIIGLSGYAQTGKDTVADHLVHAHGFVRVAFADPIREALYKLDPKIRLAESSGVSLAHAVDHMGWEEVKRLSMDARELLQRLGTEVGREMFGADFWVNQAMLRAKEHKNVVISDVRYINEADIIKAHGGVVWRIHKQGISAINQHESERNLDRYEFKVHINNDSDFENLYDLVDSYINLYK